VNILRDLPEDLRNGRCYIPTQALAAHGLTPQDLFDRDAMPRFRPLYDNYLKLAEEHLRAGWRYTTSLPFGCVRIRLACAWPVLIGVKTLRLLRGGNVLVDERVKVTRSEMRRLIGRSILLYPSRRAWNRLFEK
jgi:farnesyl-diphosphate farnesyltransferase